MHSLLVLALLFAEAPAAPTEMDEVSLFDRLSTREQILDSQRSAAKAQAKERALLAYRLLRARELGFAASPESRLENARAFDSALVALRRSAHETAAFARELDLVRGERSTTETAFVAKTLGKIAPTGVPDAGAGKARTLADTIPLARPVRGTPVALPGPRKDGPTKVELRHDSVQILARLNDPVRAVAAGQVRRVEALPQGGFAVVTAHDDSLTSIITGLRDIAVRPGDKVAAGQTLGIAGRNLDGAAVVSLEIWRNRHPQDAGRLLRLRTGR